MAVSTVPNRQQPLEHQPGSSISASSAWQETVAGLDGAAYASSTKGKVQKQLVHRYARPPSLHHSCGVNLVAALVSAVAVVALITICFSARSRAPRQGIVKRRLSEDGDSSASESLQKCEETKEGPAGGSSPQQPSGAEQGEESEPSAKLAKTETEEGTASGQAAQLAPRLSGTSSASSSKRKHRQRGPSGAQPLRLPPGEPYQLSQQAQEDASAPAGASGISSHLPQHQAQNADSGAATVTVPGPDERPFSETVIATPDEVAAAHGLLMLQLAPASAAAPSVGVSRDVEARSTSAAGAPVQALEQPGASALAHTETGSEAAQGFAFKSLLPLLQQRRPPDGAAATAGASPPDPLLSSAQGSPGQEHQHPFVRLPVVERGAVQSLFNPERALSRDTARSHLGHVCCRMRTLLAQKSLDADDVKWLVRGTEELVAHALYTQPRILARLAPSDAADLLGGRFMIFHYVLSTFHLLGLQPSGKWWEDLKSSVPQLYTAQEKKFAIPQVAFNVRLVTALSNALELMKTGVRLPDAQLVEVMRLLFCSHLSPRRFQMQIWDPWRQDDERASRSGQPAPGSA